MGYKDTCPVCNDGFKRRVQVTPGGGSIRTDDSDKVCFSPRYNRVCVH